MVRRYMIAAAGLVVLVASSASWAAEDWTLSKLVPFKKSSDSKRQLVPLSDNGLDSGSLAMPRPPLNTKTPTPAKPSTWSKITKSTKDMWNKTKRAVTPGGKSTKKPKKKSSWKNWFGSWTPGKRDKPDETLEDWMIRPRPM